MQRVAAALECREAKPDCRAKHNPVANCEAGQPSSDQPQPEQLRQFLDQAGPEEEQQPASREQGLKDGGSQYAEDTANNERPGGEARDDVTVIVVQVPDDGRRGDKEASQQDDGRDHIDVAGESG